VRVTDYLIDILLIAVIFRPVRARGLTPVPRLCRWS